MGSNENILENLERFQTLLCNYATGGQAEEADFQQLRDQLQSIPSLWDRLPRFVRNYENLEEFLAFIRVNSSTYRDRRDFLRKEFAPLLEEFKMSSQAPSDSSVAETLSVLNSDTVHESWRRALDRRFDDPDGAITAARTLLETVCKHILDDIKVEYKEHFDLPKLYRLIANSLDLTPNKQLDPIFRQVLGGCTAVVEGIGAIRNALGDAHGKGQSFVKPELRHAELVVNLAGAAATFLVQTWEDKK